MNCYSDLVLSAELVEKYKHVLPIFCTPGTDTFKEDPVFNAMMAINLDEHKDLDRCARRSNLLRNIIMGRIFARRRAGRTTGRLLEYVEKNPEQNEYPNVSDEQLRTIVRNGLRDGSDMIEGVDFIFPDDRDEDEVRDASDRVIEVLDADHGECVQEGDLTGARGLDGSNGDPPVQGRVHIEENGSCDIRKMFDSDSESDDDDPEPPSNKQEPAGPGTEKDEECTIVSVEKSVGGRLNEERIRKRGDSDGDEGEAANVSTGNLFQDSVKKRFKFLKT